MVITPKSSVLSTSNKINTKWIQWAMCMGGKEITIIEDQVMSLRGSVRGMGGVGGQSRDRNNARITLMYEK